MKSDFPYRNLQILLITLSQITFTFVSGFGETKSVSSLCEETSKQDPDFNSSTVQDTYKYQIPSLVKALANYDKLKKSRNLKDRKALEESIAGIEHAKWDSQCALEKISLHIDQLTPKQKKIFRTVESRLIEFKTGDGPAD